MRPRFLIWILLVIAAVFSGLFAFEYFSERICLRRNPPPGRMIDVGGYKLHLNCSGQGSPAVILEGGLGDSSLIWHDVQQSISKFARVCSYDRGGLGWSDKSPLARDPLNETTELHLLIERAQIPQPVLLVGHSMGGDLVRLYASRFPERVAGVLLVEASNEDKWNRIPGLPAQWEGFRKDCRGDVWKARVGWLRFEQKPPEDYPRSVQALAAALGVTPKAAEANCDEINSIIGDGPGQVAQANTLWNIPVIVITAGKNIFDDDPDLPEREKAGELWKAMQIETAVLSQQSEHVFAANSGHFVQHDDPDFVVMQVRRLLAHTEPSATDTRTPLN